MKSKTFKQWMLTNLKDYIPDIVKNGIREGYPLLTYDEDTGKLYDEFKDEIWEMILDYAEEWGYENVGEFLVNLEGMATVGSRRHFESCLVWWAATIISEDYMAEEKR